jgi:hypothetical protein
MDLDSFELLDHGQSSEKGSGLGIKLTSGLGIKLTS